MQELGIVPGGRKVVLGMVHLRPLPGTPYYERDSLASIVDVAVRSATALAEGGADGCLVQTADRVYAPGEESDPARTAAMELVVSAVARETAGGFVVGVQMMQNALKASLAVAKVAGASYIRASAVVGATLTGHGMVEARPLEVMEYRAKIGAQDVKIVGEVGSMHFEWLGGARTAGEVARAAVAVGADAVALGHRDEGRTLEMIALVREAVPGTAVILAGYTSHENAARLPRRLFSGAGEERAVPARWRARAGTAQHCRLRDSASGGVGVSGRCRPRIADRQRLGGGWQYPAKLTPDVGLGAGAPGVAAPSPSPTSRRPGEGGPGRSRSTPRRDWP
jgi:uncharacterized protein